MLRLESLAKGHAGVGIPQCTLVSFILRIQAVSVHQKGELDK